MEVDGGLAEADQRQLIGRSFYVYTRVRSLVAASTVLGALVARHGLGIGVPVEALTALAALIVLYNAVGWSFFRRYRDAHAASPVFPRLLAVTYGAVVLDYLALSAALWLVGGARSPLTALYVLHVVVSSILLSRRAALSLTGVAYLLLVALVAVEWSGLATPPRPPGLVAGTGRLGGRFALTLVLVHGVLLWATAFLLQGLVRSLRSVERRMRLANAELTRLSQQRRDFLHIATHNLRAPLGALTMLLDNMRAGLAGPVSETQRDWLERGLRRLAGLDELMSGLRTLASLESDIVRTQFSHVDLAALAARLVEEHADVAAARHQSLTLELAERVPPVVGHERLLHEAVVNYLTNALEYTPAGGHVVVRVLQRAPIVRVEVQDDGPGIDPADQERLFEEFVRLGGPGAERARGRGLGLSIVRRIALAHGGRTGVVSRKGEGSTFYLELPAFVG